MGKRGPKPQLAKKGTTAVRLDPSLKQELEAVAAANGRSLSEEIRTRLAIPAGNEQDLALLALVAASLRRIHTNTGHRWYEHPWSFQEARAAINEALSYLQPEGAAAIPDDHPMLAHLRAAGIGPKTIADATADIESGHTGKQIARLLIEGIEKGLPVSDGRALVDDLRDVGETLRTRVIAAGKSGLATDALADAIDEMLGEPSALFRQEDVSR